MLKKTGRGRRKSFFQSRVQELAAVFFPSFAKRNFFPCAFPISRASSHENRGRRPVHDKRGFNSELEIDKGPRPLPVIFCFVLGSVERQTEFFNRGKRAAIVLSMTVKSFRMKKKERFPGKHIFPIRKADDPIP